MEGHQQYSFLDAKVFIHEDKVLIKRNLTGYINFLRFRKLPSEIEIRDINSCYIDEGGFLSKPKLIIEYKGQKSEIRFNKNGFMVQAGLNEAKNFIEELKDKTELNDKTKLDKTDSVREYKRTCRNCSTVWHVSVEESEKLEELSKTNSILGGITALSGNLTASAQATRNKDAHKEKLREQKKCPECGSQNFDEEIVTY